MGAFNARSIASEKDLEAIADLFNTCETVEQHEAGTSVSELRHRFNHPLLDQARDLRLWEEPNGRLIGFGQLSIEEVNNGVLEFRVYPSARGGDLETQIIAWGEKRMREVAPEHSLCSKLRSNTRADQTDRIVLLEAHDFKIDRYFFRMVRSLAEPLPEPQLPTGFTLRQFQGEQESEAMVVLFNQTFIDHWNHHDLTVEQFKYYLSDSNPNYRPEFALIAIALDGTYAAFCYCEINPEENKRNGRNEGWIGVLGTRRGFRGRGLGRAMLISGLQQLKAAGVDTAKLIVDAENSSGALRLYESVGFRKVHTQIIYVKDLGGMALT